MIVIFFKSKSLNLNWMHGHDLVHKENDNNLIIILFLSPNKYYWIQNQWLDLKHDQYNHATKRTWEDPNSDFSY